MKTPDVAELYGRSDSEMSTGKPTARGVCKGAIHIPQVPIEWLDASSWRLPSGKALAEFALQAGFLAPLLLKTDLLGLGREARLRQKRLDAANQLTTPKENR